MELSRGLDNGDGNGTAADGQLHVDEIDSSTLICSAVGMIKDIDSGSGSSYPDYLTAVGTTLYFRATDGTNGYELWKSDGTASGTVMVKDITAEVAAVIPDLPHSRWYHPLFRSQRRNQRIRIVEERWNSLRHGDGQDISSGSGSSSPDRLTAVGTTLYFRADDGTNGYELWKSDGTASGTVMVKDINSGSGGSYPSSLTAVGNTLYFRATDGTNGYELWKSDGTASGTVMVKDIDSGS